MKHYLLYDKEVTHCVYITYVKLEKQIFCTLLSRYISNLMEQWCKNMKYFIIKCLQNSIKASSLEIVLTLWHREYTLRIRNLCLVEKNIFFSVIWVYEFLLLVFLITLNCIMLVYFDTIAVCLLNITFKIIECASYERFSCWKYYY